MSIVETTASETANGLIILWPRCPAVPNVAVVAANGAVARSNGLTIPVNDTATREGAVDAATSALG
jgi:hypothetical protein